MSYKIQIQWLIYLQYWIVSGLLILLLICLNLPSDTALGSDNFLVACVSTILLFSISIALGYAFLRQIKKAEKIRHSRILDEEE